jgi:hypothetical protein
MSAGWVIGLLAAAGGIGYFVYEHEKAAPGASTTPASTPQVAPTACAQAQSLVNARLANMDQDMGVLYPPYTYWANLCTAGGGTPPPWPG